MNSLLLITPPASEPLTLAEAKAHLRVDDSTDDNLIAALITAARQACESYTASALITQSWRLWLDRINFEQLIECRVIPLARAPLLSITGVSSFDENGVETPFPAANYYSDTASKPGRLVLKDFSTWPSPMRRAAALKIDFEAGYGANTATVPAPIRQGLLQHIAYLYEHRGDDTAGDIPGVARALYQPYCLVKVA